MLINNNHKNHKYTQSNKSANNDNQKKEHSEPFADFVCISKFVQPHYKHIANYLHEYRKQGKKEIH